jgi:hypothetical protein
LLLAEVRFEKPKVQIEGTQNVRQQIQRGNCSFADVQRKTVARFVHKVCPNHNPVADPNADMQHVGDSTDDMYKAEVVPSVLLSSFQRKNNVYDSCDSYRNLSGDATCILQEVPGLAFCITSSSTHMARPDVWW